MYKIVDVFRSFRPDLGLILVDTEPTGLLLICDLDPSSTVLDARIDQLVTGFVTPDPQSPPEEILERRQAVSPDVALDRLANRRTGAGQRRGPARRARGSWRRSGRP